MANKKSITIISLGGSLIYPTDEPDAKFLKAFVEFIQKRTRRGERFVIFTGGGKVCRRYQSALAKIRPATGRDLDWLGIHVTHLNAHFIRAAFGRLASEQAIIDPTVPIRFDQPIVIGAGWKPGCSTDYDAVLLAENIGARTIINLTNIDSVYDTDPRKNSAAKAIKNLSWTELRQLIGNIWKPGLNSPFDPVASRKAQRLGLRIVIANGKKLKNLQNILDGRPFRGTTIQ
ncbi:MAG: UMP kinase [Patescibacteria group bacterium]